LSLNLLVVALGIAALPLYTVLPTRQLPALPYFPLGVTVSAMLAGQGVATMTGADRSAVILGSAGVSPFVYGAAMAGLGALAVGVCWTGFGGRRLVAVLTIPGAALLLGVVSMAALFVSSSHWILTASAYVRVVGHVAAAFVPVLNIDWRSAFARTAVTVTSTAITPLILVVALVLYGPSAAALGVEDRQLMFGLIMLLIIASVFGALFAARGLTGPLFGLAQLLRRSSVDALAQKRPLPITEVDVLRRSVVELYDKLLAQNAELQRANASKDEFLGLVSHELKTPITTILGASSLIRQRMGPGEEGIIDDLDAGADRRANIVDNLLAMARLDSGIGAPAEPVLLNRIAQREVERAAKRDTTREYKFVAEGEAVVEAVPEQISMVLRNFLTNAAKYSPDGSAIDVRVSTTDGNAILAVHDHGTSLKPEEAENVFQPFYRSVWADRHTTGVGIGLAVCRRVAEALGGLVEVKLGADALGGNGTEFRLQLPQATSDYELADEPDAVAEPALARANV